MSKKGDGSRLRRQRNNQDSSYIFWSRSLFVDACVLRGRFVCFAYSPLFDLLFDYLDTEYVEHNKN